MTIATGQVITYQDLIDRTLAAIKEMCCNVDALSVYVPAQLRNGYAATVASNSTYLAAYDGRYENLAQTPISISLTETVRPHSYLNVVSSSTVRSQLIEFLTNRGIASKASTVITLRGLLNYISNVSSFINAKCIYVVSSRASTGVVAYNQSANSYIGLITDNNEPIDQYVINDFNGLVQSLSGAISRVYNVSYQLSMTCCSSCSSSCSSSSSSSSSSSFFIAYMNIR